MPKKINLEISLNKKKYKIGDPIIIKYTLTNINNRQIRILPWGFEYVTNNIKIFDNKKQKKMKEVHLLIYELKFIPSQDDFLLLKPHDSFTKIFKGTIKKERLAELNHVSNSAFSYIKGLFIDFENSAIFLEDAESEYIIKAIFKSNKEAIEKGYNLYGFNDTWDAEIESNEIKFFINN